MTPGRTALICRLLVFFALYFLFCYTNFFFEMVLYPEHMLYELGLAEMGRALETAWFSLNDMVIGLAKLVLPIGILWQSVLLLFDTVRQPGNGD